MQFSSSRIAFTIFLFHYYAKTPKLINIKAVNAIRFTIPSTAVTIVPVSYTHLQ